MIDLYTGTPGSGKSLHAIERIYNYLRIYKGPVLANFEVKVNCCYPKGDGSFFYISNNRLSPDLLYEFSERYRSYKHVRRLKEETILLVIDEAQILFNARSWSQSDRMSWITFFSQHRKLGYRIILICQYSEMIDKQIRCLIEHEYIHRKVKNVGFWGKVISLISLGDLHICNIYHISTGIQISRYFFKGNQFLYFIYDSYTRFDEDSLSGLRSEPDRES